MDRLEKRELLRTHTEMISLYDKHYRFTADDICNIHKNWLENIYEWAGKFRSVNVSKGDFAFAAATQVPKLMRAFEKRVLGKFTPCNFPSIVEIVKAIACVHTELILIHPFREGNGRVARLFSDLMAAQAGLPLLDFSGIAKYKRKEYILAIHAGMERNYKPMEKLFGYIIRKTLQTHEQRT